MLSFYFLNLESSDFCRPPGIWKNKQQVKINYSHCLYFSLPPFTFTLQNIYFHQSFQCQRPKTLSEHWILTSYLTHNEKNTHKDNFQKQLWYTKVYKALLHFSYQATRLYTMCVICAHIFNLPLKFLWLHPVLSVLCIQPISVCLTYSASCTHTPSGVTLTSL